jgi:bacillithiol biosynthesis cysteine-adding enzyme BshC
MLKDSYSFSEFGFSSQLIRDLVDEKKKVEPFINSFFSEEVIAEQVKNKTFTATQRKTLVDSLISQNRDLKLSSATKSNIEKLLSEDAYTITTGHQLNLITGPLYSIYKILQVIAWADKLNQSGSTNKFIPVFWMASEDHDFEEINHINLFGSKIEWNKKGQEDFIAGKIELNDFTEFKDNVLAKFSDEKLRSKVEELLNHYNSKNLASSTRSLLNEMFGGYGLVIIDGDDVELKKQFKPIIESEIKTQVVYNSVSKTNEQLEVQGYHNQVFLRESNLFYIENSTTRQRIVKVENGFEINNQIFNETELLKLVDEFPERFSPNALMRPLYQETVLPNICYVGGGGEIAYWLQLKDLFENSNLEFPILRVRDSFLLLSDKHKSSIDEVGFSILELKQHIDDLSKEYVKLNAGSDVSITEELEFFNQLKNGLTQKVESKDLSVQRFIEGEMVRMQSQLEKIEKKLIQSEKKSQESNLKKISRIKRVIYPNDGFQERYENILQYISNDNFIQEIKKEVEQSMTIQPQIKIINI